jgi:hypothetical protein
LTSAWLRFGSEPDGRRRTREPIAEVYARTDEAAERARTEVLAAYDLGEDAPPPRPIVLETIA